MTDTAPKRKKSFAKWIIAAACWTIGIALFLIATEGLTRDSETALVQGSWGLVPFLAAGGGAFIGRRGAGWAILYAGIFLTGTAVGLGLFFESVWGSL